MLSPDVSTSLPEFYSAESYRIRQAFKSSADGRAAALARSKLVDAVAIAFYRAHLSADSTGPENFCLAAIGGFGRGELFPHSDVDLLFLSEGGRAGAGRREATSAVARALWDIGLRVSNTSRTLAECGELHRNNLEFNVALLDSRFLAGDSRLFARLRERTLPHLVARDRAELVRRLVEMTHARHQKHGNTIFHLEPNLKEAPGGMRDYHVARWLARIFELEGEARWTSPEEFWPPALREEAASAYAFLAAARTFLHFGKDRDDNQLTYELQDESAALGIGIPSRAPIAPEEWMRSYFRHARAVSRLSAKLLEEGEPPGTSLYGLFQDWRSRLSTPDFSVVRGRIFPRRPATVNDPPVSLLALFELSARHGLELSHEAERRVEETLPRFDDAARHSPGLWASFRQILTAPHAPEALRAMHRLGLLDALFPEFRAIDSLVVRDYYHRYTVDAHSLLTLENLTRLGPRDRGAAILEWEQKFSAIFHELEQPELLFVALLFHDVGKGTVPDDHVRGSLEAVTRVFERLGMNPEDRGIVRFLIQNHLEMSATLLRRDIFDPEVVRAFSEKIGTTERLKMLTLLTFTDVKSVNPEALTPWKAEMLWQLYAAATNYLTRSLAQERFHAGEEQGLAARVLLQLTQPAQAEQLNRFLEGFPRRYLLTHSPEEIAAHFEMSRRLSTNPVALSLRDREHSFELTVMTRDRSFLFASIAGALTAWGMNILKADAYANAGGIVLDTFRFSDLHRTIELNPAERERFQQSVTEALEGKANLEALLRGRIGSASLPRIKVRIPTRIRFEEPPPHLSGPARSTLLEVITQDRPGLLYQISSILADLSLNIEVALIDTEGQKAIDVFYLTAGGAKLDSARQEAVRDELLRRLS